MARHYFPHIYFEASIPRTRDSVTRAVNELDEKPGVTSFEEYKLLALALIADYIDGKTVDHAGRKIKFTRKLMNGRILVLMRLGKKRFPKNYRRIIQIIKKAVNEMNKTKHERKRRKIVFKTARALGIHKRVVERIMRRVRQ